MTEPDRPLRLDERVQALLRARCRRAGCPSAQTLLAVEV